MPSKKEAIDYAKGGYKKGTALETFNGVLALELTRAGHGKTLLGAALGLHLRHVVRIWWFGLRPSPGFTFSVGA